MADDTSALTAVTRFNMQLLGLLTALDIELIGKQTAQVITDIKSLSGDARLDVRDWEMSDSRAEMQANARQAEDRLEALRAKILRASENGIFSAIDIAHLSAQIDVIIGQVR